MSRQHRRSSETYLLVMGVAGTGKSAVGHRLAAALSGEFIEADQFHSSENVAKMRAGRGLTDADREPWLHAVCEAARDSSCGPVVIGCSALKRSYRDLIRDRLGDVRLVFLDGTRELVSARLSARKGHFASVSLMDSQFETLERPGIDEAPIILDIALPLDELVAVALRELKPIPSDASLVL